MSQNDKEKMGKELNEGYGSFAYPDKNEKPKVDKSLLERSIKDHDRAVKNIQTVKK